MDYYNLQTDNLRPESTQMLWCIGEAFDAGMNFQELFDNVEELAFRSLLVSLMLIAVAFVIVTMLTAMVFFLITRNILVFVPVIVHT